MCDNQDQYFSWQWPHYLTRKEHTDPCTHPRKKYKQVWNLTYRCWVFEFKFSCAIDLISVPRQVVIRGWQEQNDGQEPFWAPPPPSLAPTPPPSSPPPWTVGLGTRGLGRYGCKVLVTFTASQRSTTPHHTARLIRRIRTRARWGSKLHMLITFVFPPQCQQCAITPKPKKKSLFS